MHTLDHNPVLTNQRECDGMNTKAPTVTDAEREFGTPRLREAWRTAPYLDDGRAATMEEVLRIKSKRTPDLGDGELRVLAEYVLSM